MLGLLSLVLLSAPPVGDELEARVGKGEILLSTEKVLGSDMPKVKVRAVIDAPPEKVWAVIDDCGGYSRHLPGLKASSELSRSGHHVICRSTAAMPFPFKDLTVDTVATQTVVPGIRWTRNWTMVKGDYEVNDGSWVLTPFQRDRNRTLAVYELHVSPKIGVPRAMVAEGEQNALKDIVLRLRQLTSAR